MKNRKSLVFLPWKTALFLGMSLIFLGACKSNSEGEANAESEIQEVITAFSEEIEAFEIADSQEMPPKRAALFVGSSSFRMWKTLEEDMAPYPVINRGFGGSTFRELNYYMDRLVFPYEPRCIFVYEGDNDITNEEVKPISVLANFKDFCALVEEKLPRTKVYFVSIKPSIARQELLTKATEANQMIQAWTLTQPNIDFVNVATSMMGDDGSIRTDIFVDDNLHMNETGYALWTPIIKAYLAKEFKAE